jgi:16S rRNA (cytosine967-C5)-methyltransferase
VSGARETALKALYEVEKNGAYSDKALKNALRGGALAPTDRAFAAELTYGVVRHKSRLDFIIRNYSDQRLKKLSVWILNILRMGVYQMIFLDKIPHSAAVNEGVNLAKRYGHEASARFVNAVLRAVSRGGDVKCPSLNIYYSHPDWLVDLIDAQYPLECKKILAANNEIPAVTVRVNTLKTTSGALCDALTKKGIEVTPRGELLEIAKFGDIAALEEYKNGLFTPQDKGAYLAAAAVDPRPGELILDVCAAPGGKATQIAEMSGDKAKILAFDLHAHKIDLINKNARRLGINGITAICRDAAQPDPQYIAAADKVLADVPCSGLGVIRKKPDIKWRKTPGDLKEIIALQSAVLDSSARYLKPGGILVYATCTINKDENGGVVERFLQTARFEKLKETQLLPHTDGCDGFYICKLRKK